MVQVVDITRCHAIFSAGDGMAIQTILSEQDVAILTVTDIVLAIVGGVAVSIFRVTPRSAICTSVDH